ncbi:MAG: beta-CASP ribonuclease aCPSF1 [Thermoplasmata archaeon]|nr:MAG: beta-CASP ribonuclease aCPSF1 [Thermoplasmata archaeon]HDJ26779.1 beta-CASP ribonuclease aCPSF1 [Aciduliprofundum sp.]
MPVSAEIKAQIFKHIPKTDVVEVVFEGPFLVIYLRNFHIYAERDDIPRRLAQELKKRIRLKPAEDEALDPEEAEEKARRLIPKKAIIHDVFFDTVNMEMQIELERPELVFVKPDLLKALRRETRWDVILHRKPPIESLILDFIKGVLQSTAKERKRFLRTLGEELYHKEMQVRASGKKNFVRVVALGGYREVGRSCTLVQTRNSRVIVDFGAPMGKPRDDAEENGPYYLYVAQPFDIDIHDIDEKKRSKYPFLIPMSANSLILTHAHMDHAGKIPTLIRLGYRGPIYLTKPTRDIAVALYHDYVKLNRMERGRPEFDIPDIKRFIVQSIPIGYHETTDVAPDIKLTFYHAGHILGSAIAHLHIGEGFYNIVITGDIRYGESLMFRKAENRFPRVEAVIVESTYGARDIPPRKKAVADLARIIDETVKGGGKVIIPVFAVGRAQEVMLAIEEAVSGGLMDRVEVFMDGMIDETTAIHTVYPEYMAPLLRDRITKYGENPFLAPYFHFIRNASQREEVLDSAEPLVVLTTSGMLTGGPVMEYLRAWGPNKLNSLIFVGYQAEGTLGREIQQGARTIVLPDGEEISLNLRIETVDGFSGHSGSRDLLRFLVHMHPRPKKVILCHGDEEAIKAFRRRLQEVRLGWEVLAPRNLDAIRLR